MYIQTKIFNYCTFIDSLKGNNAEISLSQQILNQSKANINVNHRYLAFSYKSRGLVNKNKHFFSKNKPGAELKYLDKNHKYFKDFRTEYLIDDTQIFRFFRNPSFFHYMNDNFRILPFLFDPKKIVKV